MSERESNAGGSSSSSFVLRGSSGNPSADGTAVVEPADFDVCQHHEILLQQTEWDDFLRNTDKDVLADSTIWQYWRKENRPASGGLGSLEKMFAKRLGVGSRSLKAQIRLKRLIRDGVPPTLRGEIWWRCGGGRELQAACDARPSSPSFSALLASLDTLSARDAAVLVEIDKDIPRTMPELKSLPGFSSILDSLRSVLLCYALRNPSIGYCQSMNFIACLLLLHMPKERAFWTLASIVEHILPHDYYSQNMLGGRVDQAVFQACLSHKLPRVSAHLQSLDCSLDPIVLPWFLCLFINVLPLFTVCRVWDSLLWEGDMILFKAGISMLRSKEEELLQCQDFVSVYCVLKVGVAYAHALAHL